MQHFSAEDVEQQRQLLGESWLELVRSSRLSSGVYALDAGAVDDQQPHTEDEIYVVVQGQATLVTPSGSARVSPGSVAFVPALEHHKFEEITDDLRLVVVFAPPEQPSS